MNISRFALLPLIAGAAATVCFAQPTRIQSRIDSSRKVVLPGRVHPLANAGNDAGAAPASFPLTMTLALKPSPDQQASLEQLLLQQQNPASTSFHRWLTPEQYADQFGASTNDVAAITQWLQSQGFTVAEVAPSRNYITFSGNSGQVQATFGTSIHRYRVNGQSHYANAGDPSIPAALSGMVAGIRGMNDFHMNPHVRKRPVAADTTGPGTHEMAPDDFAAIYDVAPLYTQKINGSGQSIAVVGQSQLYRSGLDVTQFWSKFGIGAKLVQTLAGTNPGVVQNDVDEASLDVEWAGAIARGATINFVYSSDVWNSATYAVTHNVAPVLSMSYGACEMFDLVDLPSNRQLVQQANAQGMTWLVASGDSGAADCDYQVAVAEGGLAVDAPASIPEVTAMGGTQLNDSGGSYWNTSNSSTLGSAKGYIPEAAWNDSAIDGSVLATGGGASVYFQQPAWQTGYPGVPGDGVRHLPDIAFNSSVYHVSYYVISQGSTFYVGGTSAATPTMAGVVALLNQSLNQQGVGNINPVLYQLARTAPQVFHDVAAGNNVVPCAYGSPGCNNGSQGFSAAAGYDNTTGLGSVDVANLIHSWSSATPTGALIVPSIDSNPVFETVTATNGNQWNFQLTLTEEAGTAATLTDFTIDGVSYASQIGSLFGSAGIGARQSITASDTLSLSAPKNVTFGFSGVDANGNQWSTALTVPFTGPQTRLTVAGASNAATGKQVFAPGEIMAVYGTGLGVAAQAAATVPLPQYMQGVEASINNVAVPLYYVGPNQVNLQIPYETLNGLATLSIGNPYENVNYNFQVTNVAPGIFTFPDGSVNPSRSAKAGDTVPLFITGEGRVSPSLATGTTPSASTPLGSLPKPRASVIVTVGGVTAPTTFVGIPSGLVGVTQINFTIPAGLPAGQQPVIVSVGSTATPPAYITIQ